MDKRTFFWIVVLIVVVGISIRFWHLTTRSLWFDEAFSWRLVQYPVPEMLERAARDVHPPLYYLVLKAWTVIFGSSLLAMRSLSVLLTGGSIALAALVAGKAIALWGGITKDVRATRAALLAACLVAVSGFQLTYAWEARMYSLGLVLALSSSWTLLHALWTGRWRWWAVYAVLGVAFTYVHYFAFFTLAAQGVVVLGVIAARTRMRLGEILQLPTTWQSVTAGIVMGLVYLPWVPAFLLQNSQVQQSYWVPTIGGWSIPDTFYRFWLPTFEIPAHDGLAGLLAAIPIITTLLMWVILGIIAWRRHSASMGIWLVVLAGSMPLLIAILLSMIGQSIYQDRFFAFGHIFIVIGLAIVVGLIQRREVALSLGILCVVWFGYASVLLWQELDIPRSPGARVAAEYLYDHHAFSEPIIVSSPFVYFSVLYYASHEHRAEVLPRLYSADEEISHFAGGPILETSDLIGAEVFETTSDAIWVVNTTGFGGQDLFVPEPWREVKRERWVEVFGYQGEVSVSKYERSR